MLTHTHYSKVGGGCGPCLPGYYSDELNAFRCTPCPINTYSTGGSVTCTSCPALTSNIAVGSSDCPSYSLKAPPIVFYSIFVVLLSILVSSLAVVDRHNFFSMLIMSAFPFGDVASDLQYITFNSFYNLPLFVFCMMYSLTHLLTCPYSFTYSLTYIASSFCRCFSLLTWYFMTRKHCQSLAVTILCGLG